MSVPVATPFGKKNWYFKTSDENNNSKLYMLAPLVNYLTANVLVDHRNGALGISYEAENKISPTNSPNLGIYVMLP